MNSSGFRTDPCCESGRFTKHNATFLNRRDSHQCPRGWDEGALGGTDLWTLSLPSLKSKFSRPFKEKCTGEVGKIGSIIIFHLSKLWKAKFFILYDVIFLVRLQEKFDIDHSWEWKGPLTLWTWRGVDLDWPDVAILPRVVFSEPAYWLCIKPITFAYLYT